MDQPGNVLHTDLVQQALIRGGGSVQRYDFSDDDDDDDDSDSSTVVEARHRAVKQGWLLYVTLVAKLLYLLRLNVLHAHEDIRKYVL